MKEYVLTLPVHGMRCGGCAGRLESELNALGGMEANVNFALSAAKLTLTAEAQLAKSVELIESKGYKIEKQTLLFEVMGWNCAGCATKTETKLRQHALILDAHANAATNQLKLTFITGSMKPAALIDAIAAAGYQAKLCIDSPDTRRESLKEREKQLDQQQHQHLGKVVAASVLTFPLMLHMFAMMTDWFHFHLSPWLEWALVTPIQFWIGGRFYRGTWAALKQRSANMDVLVATGTSAAYLYSIWLLFQLDEEAMGRLYFEASAMIITFISLGKYLELRAKRATTQAIYELMALRPTSARVFRAGTFVDLAIGEVVEGDKIRILAGEKVPVDGVILEGLSELDESLLTGESLPVNKQPGESVIGGAMNGSGTLLVEAIAVGHETSLSKIIKLVENAQMGKAPLQQLVDRVCAVFVPIVISIACMTFLAWWFVGAGFEFALISAVAVLVIACPCALGLATPAAIVTGTGIAARYGILIKDVDTLQKAHQIKTLVFDKTGTLTQGQPAIRQIYHLDPHDFRDEMDLMQRVASLQQDSTHPLAKAMVDYAKRLGLPLIHPEKVIVHAGAGIEGELNNQRWLIGSAELMQTNGIESRLPSGGIKEHACSWVWVAVDNKLIALITLMDPLRPESKAMVTALKALDLQTVMLSGDHTDAVNEVSEQLGLDKAFGLIKPEQKAAHIDSLQQTAPGLVAMIGDGINDAPALAQADVSIAMGEGTEVAMETANITLMRSDPRLVCDAIDISRATWLKIKQNLFWAFIFNALGIPAAAMGWLSPELAGAAMAMSSITVLVNSLLLRRWQPMLSVNP